MWGWIIGIATGIWDAVEAATTATVIALWTVVTAIWNTIRLVGGYLATFGKTAWGFLDDAWQDVIKPAIQTFGKSVWRLLRATWDDVLRPVWTHLRKAIEFLVEHPIQTYKKILGWLLTLRKYVLDVYRTYVRPVLDLLDHTRALLRILADLHVKFAATLDGEIARLEALIDKPFQFTLGKINEVIGIINRIVTLDGLLQRLVLVKSIARDARYVWRGILNPFVNQSTPAPGATDETAAGAKPIAQVGTDLRDYLETHGGQDAPLIDEAAAQARIYLNAVA